MAEDRHQNNSGVHPVIVMFSWILNCLSFLTRPHLNFFQDQLSRAGHMTPMQWSDHHNAGFTSGIKSPWLPVSDDYPEVNVEVGNEFDIL